MSARCVVRQALHVLQAGAEGDHDEGEDDRWGVANDFNLWVRTGRDAPPTLLQGNERPHAIQVSKTRHISVIIANPHSLKSSTMIWLTIEF